MFFPSACFFELDTTTLALKVLAFLTKTDAALACKPSLLAMDTVSLIILLGAEALYVSPGHLWIDSGSDRTISGSYRQTYAVHLYSQLRLSGNSDYWLWILEAIDLNSDDELSSLRAKWVHRYGIDTLQEIEKKEEK